jgi:hypothetical protein
MNPFQIIQAVGVVSELARVFAIQAEGSGASSEEKHAAVAQQLEDTYKLLQASGSVKELNGIDWELIAPLVVPVGGGLISVAVKGLNLLKVFVKKKAG